MDDLVDANNADSSSKWSELREASVRIGDDVSLSNFGVYKISKPGQPII
jgi:hypothetical protein